MLHVGAHYGASSIFARLLGGRTRRAGAFFWTWGGAPHGEEEFWADGTKKKKENKAAQPKIRVLKDMNKPQQRSVGRWR